LNLFAALGKNTQNRFLMAADPRDILAARDSVNQPLGLRLTDA